MALELTSHSEKGARASKLLKAEEVIAYVLRYGVIFCASLIGLGLALRIFHWVPVGQGTSEIISDLLGGKVLDQMTVPQTFSGFLLGALHLDPDVIVCLGLLCLIFLPILRVAMTVVLFLIERDFVYLGITLVVFSVLMSGIIFGRVL